MKSKVEAILARHLDRIVRFRRELHQHPELSGAEKETAARIAARLEEVGIPFRAGVGGNNVVAELGQGGPCVALRADIDALPIQERTDLAWASRVRGVMHACGHDFHTAWLLGAALVLREIGVQEGSVRFLFQHSEEGPGGAPELIAAGGMGPPEPIAIVAAHVTPGLRVGQIAIRSGPVMAAPDAFEITVHGSGTHAARPHRGTDVLSAGAHLVLALQGLARRVVDPVRPAVVTVCTCHAGKVPNVVPSELLISGTVRTVTEEDRDDLEREIRALARAVAASHRCEAQVVYQRGVPAVVNDPSITGVGVRVAERVLGEEQVVQDLPQTLGAEDFACYLERSPGLMMFVGSSADLDGTRRLELHQPSFMGDDACLAPAILVLVLLALELLAQHRAS